jgi:FkbM family methyltransferase
MKKIFLDCGGNIGQSIDNFKNSAMYSPDFIMYSFEPNPIVNAKYRNRKDITFLDRAVWINDSMINLYISKRHGYVGSSLMAGKTSGRLDLVHPLVVQALDLSKWIMDNFEKTDYIILKMDVEGAEYDIL